MRNKVSIILIIFVALLVSMFFLSPNKPSNDSFKAPGNDYNSPKKVESYFINTLRMTPAEAVLDQYGSRESVKNMILGSFAYCLGYDKGKTRRI